MRSEGRILSVCLMTMAVIPVPAQAGMTVYGLNDFYRLRLEEISFFIVLLLVCALGVKWLWNYAVRGFGSWPRMGYKQALVLTVLFGMGMLLLLTMISGIREVLTPGAWRKQGTAYRLNDPAQEEIRMRSLAHLRSALFDYARLNGGKFPAVDFVPEIPEKLWESPDQELTRYRYHGGWTTNDRAAVIVEEPLVFGDPRFVLLGSGAVEKRSNAALKGEPQAANKP